MSIPRIIHQTWKTSRVPEAFRAFQREWQTLHPGYEYRLWTDEDNAAFVEREFPEHVPLYRSFTREIFRADLVRYLYLQKFGGIYVDLDVEPLRSVDCLLAGAEQAWLGAEPAVHARRLFQRDRVTCNAVMASVPGHPFWACMLDEIRTRAADPARQNPVEVTGPAALHAAWEKRGAALGVHVTAPDTFFPLPDVDNAHLGLSERERLHYRRMVELHQFPSQSFGVHHWAHTWIPSQGTKRIALKASALARDAKRVLLAETTIDEVARPSRYGVHFPEHAFSARPARARRYREEVMRGAESASQISAHFLVLLRDRIDLALLLRARLERLIAPFARARISILCDDSTDGTAEVIRDWQRARPDLVETVPVPSSARGASSFRKLAKLRNALLEATEQRGDAELIFVLDGDLEGPVSSDGLLHAVALLSERGGPDAVSAFGVNNWGGFPGLFPFLGYSYYDPIAFRERSFERTLTDAMVRRRLGGLRRGDAPLQVSSAFAGLAIYRAEQLRGLRYDTATRDCEHVSLHRAFAAQGSRLVLDPSLLLLAGRQGHHRIATRRVSAGLVPAGL